MIRNIAITACGLIALLTPLVLWVAWSRTMFWLVILVACTAILVLLLLIRWWPDERI